ncbi:MAG: hypothetical protein WDW36_008750 [Sanguina aurantia]
MNRKKPPPIDVPEEKPTSYVLTNTGIFTEGDLSISREGLHINPPARPNSSSSQEAAEGPDSLPSQGGADACGSGHSGELSPDDLEDLGVIGSGSSGVAKRVRNRRTGQTLVLKVINFDVSSDTTRKQITTELRTLHGSTHGSVVRYHQAFFDNGAITILMEYMDKGSLADLLKVHVKIPERYIAAIARQTVAGLLYLHKELRVVHRDIKPSNLLMNDSGELKISDFGVSGQLTGSVSNCHSWVGTVSYMSPERIKGECYSYDSDLWSLGLTLVECALGRFPYPPPAEAGIQLGFWELLEYIVMEAAPALPRAEFSPELADFVSACLQKDSRTRASVSQLAQHPFLELHQGANLADLFKGPNTCTAAGCPDPTDSAGSML